MRYHTFSLAFLTLVSIAASASELFLPIRISLRLISSLLGIPCSIWHYYHGQSNPATAGDGSAYPQQGPNGVSALVSRSDGVSGDDGKHGSCEASPETSSADNTVVRTEEKDAQQAASTSSNTSIDGRADTAVAPVATQA